MATKERLLKFTVMQTSKSQDIRRGIQLPLDEETRRCRSWLAAAKWNTGLHASKCYMTLELYRMMPVEDK
jgi:hypothetical protein